MEEHRISNPTDKGSSPFTCTQRYLSIIAAVDAYGNWSMHKRIKLRLGNAASLHQCIDNPRESCPDGDPPALRLS